MNNNEIVEIFINSFSVFSPIFIMFFGLHFVFFFLRKFIFSFENNNEIEELKQQEKYFNLADYEEDSPIKNFY